MPQDQTNLMDPPIEGLLDKVDSKFTLVALAARRARPVNSYYNSLGEGLGVVVPPQVASPSGKPLSIAFEEVAEGKATYTRLDPEEVARVEAEAAALALLEGEGAGDGGGTADGEAAVAEDAAVAEAAAAESGDLPAQEDGTDGTD
jgi:DNA-directed RNA polymerase subunit omega